MPRTLIETVLLEHEEAVKQVAGMSGKIEDCAEQVVRTLQSDGKILICGNGGSAAAAQHFSAEMTGRFEADRRGYPAIALTADTSVITAVGNDYGFEQIFSRQVEALGRPGDMLIVISTSGNSANLLQVAETAQERGLFVVGLLGRDGGALAPKVDLPLTVGVSRTARIQEAHLLILHLLCALFEART